MAEKPARALRAAFPCTIPVMMGYLFLGIAFGVLLVSKGLSPWWALAMSVFVYAGSMQFVAISLLTGPFSLLNTALVTLSVNARHLFYGLSLLERFHKMGKLKPYLIFSLTDETYSLLCTDPPEGVSERWFSFFVALLDQCYWVAGSMLGALAGSLIPFNAAGIDFAMTALFLVIFVEQWEKRENRLPALIGLGVTFLCLVIFGSGNFILWSMGGILICLSIPRKKREGGRA